MSSKSHWILSVNNAHNWTYPRCETSKVMRLNHVFHSPFFKMSCQVSLAVTGFLCSANVPDVFLLDFLQCRGLPAEAPRGHRPAGSAGPATIEALELSDGSSDGETGKPWSEVLLDRVV